VIPLFVVADDCFRIRTGESFGSYFLFPSHVGTTLRGNHHKNLDFQKEKQKEQEQAPSASRGGKANKRGGKA